MDADLKILNQLPYEEVRPLERELKEPYHEYLEKLSKLEALAKRIRSKCTFEKFHVNENDAIKDLIEILIGHSPVEFEKEILAGEPL